MRQVRRVLSLCLAAVLCLTAQGCSKKVSPETKAAAIESMKQSINQPLGDFQLIEYYKAALQALGLKEASFVSFHGSYQSDTKQINSLTMQLIDTDKKMYTIMYGREMDTPEGKQENILFSTGSTNRTLYPKSPTVFCECFERNKDLLNARVPRDGVYSVQFEWSSNATSALNQRDEVVTVDGQYNTMQLAFRVYAVGPDGQATDTRTILM